MTSSVAFTVPLIASALLLIVAPLLVAHGYDWRRHSISESAAQGVRLAWVARAGLFLLGWAAGARALGAPGLALGTQVGLFTFGLAMMCSAVWSKRPWSDAMAFDAREDRRHSLAAKTAGVAYVVAVLSQLMAQLHTGRELRPLTWLALLTAIACPIVGARVPSINGVAQRMMFGVCYFWLYILGP